MCAAPKLPKDFLARCRAIKAKRPKTVITHILKHGSITTADLKDTYGYNHPPRAVRDVKDHGIPIEKFSATGPDGRKIAAYRFGDPTKARPVSFLGRNAPTKQLKAGLLRLNGARCALFLKIFPEGELQIDHRVPYEIGGDGKVGSVKAADFMLLCRSANRAKSWSCEHCPNFTEAKNPEVCRGCYWAFPENYTHIATRDERRLDLIWVGDEVGEHDALKGEAEKLRQDLPEFVKSVLKARRPPA